MIKIAAVLATMLLGISAFAQNTGNLLNKYNEVKNALVNSNGETAGTAIAGFHQAVNSEENFSEKAELLKASEKLSKAGTNLDKQRAAFGDVSTIMWKLVKNSDKVKQPVYYHYCPMKKANWLSNEKEVKNPYYGSSMLTCGKVQETKL